MASPATEAGLLLHPGALLAAAALSAVVTALAIGYGRRRLLDLPGARRSHRVPTPRGGGIGIVVAVVALGFGPALATDPRAYGIALAFGAVAAIGWLDDHRPVPAAVRLALHLAAAALVVWTVAPWWSGGTAAAWALGAAAVLAVAWSVNLHNFMDGIDGLLAMQGSFVLAVLAFALARAGALAPAHIAAAAAVATLAFVPFNAPRAHVFMGDVGSGAIGLLAGALGLVAIARGALDLPQVLVLGSGFVIDATATLLSRIVRGRRWHAPHREHLYQWLARAGLGHARVTAAYLGWNLAVVAPAVYLAHALTRGRAGSVYSWAVAAAVYALGLGLWLVLKRRLAARR
ncbi:MAG TPA: glycosyl transferase family 4 [Xanthomonadales bacterium]|nr:glycosyl transferase family 4 [Xanthomonadales bacterium]